MDLRAASYEIILIFVQFGMPNSSKQFYLASASPRRYELLRRVGLDFISVPVEMEELSREGEQAMDFVVRMAVEKANRAVDLIKNSDKPELPVLAADTCISLSGQILGKPQNEKQAESMLRSLSGRTHDVYTAVALVSKMHVWEDLSVTQVTLGTLSAEEIKVYCASGEPLDKAGAYAIQGLGSAFVKRIEGSYTGVVGLPMYETHRLLAKIGIDWL